eukprot:749594_1
MKSSNVIGRILESTDVRSHLMSYLTMTEICNFARVCLQTSRVREAALAEVRVILRRDLEMHYMWRSEKVPMNLVRAGMLVNVRIFNIGEFGSSEEVDILLSCPLVERISSFKISSGNLHGSFYAKLKDRVFPSLTHIRLSDASPEILTFLTKFPNLKSLEFPCSYMSQRAEKQSVLAFLDANPQLTEIQEFHHMCVGVSGSVEIIDRILTMPNLQCLGLSINQGMYLGQHRVLCESEGFVNYYPNAKCASTLRSVRFFRQSDIKNYMWPAYPNLTEFECSRFCFDSLSCSPECSSYDGCMSAECGHNNWWYHLRILRLTDSHDAQKVYGMSFF